MESLEANESNKQEPVMSVDASSESKLVLEDQSENKEQPPVSIAKTVATTKSNEIFSFDAKQKKKFEKLADSILKKNSTQLDENLTSETKYYLMIQSYMDLQEQNKKLQLSNKETEKTIQSYIKQRDLIQTDYNKSVLAKNKLESLCRELQRHNKLIKEENLQRMKEEEEKRKEISTKFQSAIDEINTQVSSNTEKNNGLIQENLQLTTKLKNLLEQYEAREQQVEKILKHKDLENQLANAKFQQSELKLAELSERHKSEKTIYENHCIELNKKCEFHQEAEKQLRSQLSMYTEKYEEFQSTLKKSNQVFESFRTEMDKMTKKIKKLEQETSLWKSKCETSEKCLQGVMKQKDEMDERYKKIQVKADMMEKLSRTLQTERNELKEKLKVYEPVSAVVAAPIAFVDPTVSEQSQPVDEQLTQSVPCSDEIESKVEEKRADEALTSTISDPVVANWFICF